jgi:predicted GIY-YIG superfamily endonuclease
MSRVSAKPYFVYVLRTPSGHRFYTGISEDPQHRTDQHNQAIWSWTARYRLWELVHVERFNTYTDAGRRELRVAHTLPWMHAPVDHAAAGIYAGDPTEMRRRSGGL